MALIGRKIVGAATLLVATPTTKQFMSGPYAEYVAEANQEVFNLGMHAPSGSGSGSIEIGVSDVTDGTDDAPLVAAGTISNIVADAFNEVSITPASLIEGRTYTMVFRVISDFFISWEDGYPDGSRIVSDLDGTSALPANFSYPVPSDFTQEIVVYAETQSSAVPTSIISGTIASTTVQQNIVDGGKSAKSTLTDAVFKAAGTGPIGTILESQTLVNNYVSAQNEAGGWNLQVIPLLNITTNPEILNRISDTVCELTLPPVPGYVITANEINTWTVPTDVLVSGGPIVSTPTNTILAAIGGGGVIRRGTMNEAILIIGSDSNILRFTAFQENSSDKFTTLDFDTAGLTIFSDRIGVAGDASSISPADGTKGEYLEGGINSVPNQPGEYDFGLPDTVTAAGVEFAKVIISGVSGMEDVEIPISLMAGLNQTNGNIDSVGEVTSPVVAASVTAPVVAASVTAPVVASSVTGSVGSVTSPVTAGNMVEQPNNDGIVANGVGIAANNAAIAANNEAIAALVLKINSLGISKNADNPNFKFSMFLVNGDAGINLEVSGQRSIDGGDFADVSGAITEITGGAYRFDALAADTNGDDIMWRFIADGANQVPVSFKTVS